MKLISLNIWGGAQRDLLLPFLKDNADVDFFLFQEIYDHATEMTNWGGRGSLNIFDDIKAALPDHTGYFAPAQGNEFGLAGFISSAYKSVESGDVFVHRSKDAMVGSQDAATLGRNLQYFKIGEKNPFTLMNFHGLWTGGGKGDTESRIAQSTKIAEFARTLAGEFVLTGDFNLLPETESVKLLESMNVKNLIKEFGITNTRTAFYTKPEKYADYTFVTPGITVRDFKVLPDEVSDHAALYLEFDIA